MRVVFAIVLLSVSWIGVASAAQSNSCKQCSDDRRACMTGYSGKTCQIAYERCMKACKK
jgi:hypothetical protein